MPNKLVKMFVLLNKWYECNNLGKGIPLWSHYAGSYILVQAHKWIGVVTWAGFANCNQVCKCFESK